MFPHRLTDSRAYAIAQAMLDGFNRHYRLFSETNRAAKRRFEQADWHGQQRAQALRLGRVVGVQDQVEIAVLEVGFLGIHLREVHFDAQRGGPFRRDEGVIAHHAHVEPQPADLRHAAADAPRLTAQARGPPLLG